MSTVAAKCFFKECKTTTNINTLPAGVTVHCIPKNRASIYLYICGNYFDTDYDQFINKDYQYQRVCSKHFSPEQFMFVVREGYQRLVKQLRPNQIPLIANDRIITTSTQTLATSLPCDAGTQTGKVSLFL